LKIIQNLCSEASDSCSLLNSKPQLEFQEDDQGETLWAALDYGTMSLSTDRTTSSVSLDNTSLDTINILGTDIYDLSVFHRSSPIPASHGYPNDDVSYHNLTLDGMTPLAAFFGSDPALDTFGG
jgi:hypothetical protein